MIDLSVLEARIEGNDVTYLRGFGVTSVENPCVAAGRLASPSRRQ